MRQFFMLAKVRGLQTAEKQGEAREDPGQRCNKYAEDIMQKILGATEGCTAGVKRSRQTGRVGSKEGGS